MQNVSNNSNAIISQNSSFEQRGIFDLITRKEAAEYLKVSLPTLSRILQNCKINVHRVDGCRRVYISAKELEAKIKQS